MMMTEIECLNKIQSFGQTELIGLWQDIVQRRTDEEGWLAGKAFELLILRAFELEGCQVTWPYSVKLFDEIVEQIDGVVYITEYGFSVMIESKDYQKRIDIAPIVKLRSQLQRRPTGVIGSVFSASGFTDPALILGRFTAPQTILLWNPPDIDHCLTEGYFKEGLLEKYRYCIEHGLPDKKILMT